MEALLETLFDTDIGIVILGIILLIAVVICYFQK